MPFWLYKKTTETL
uniref:Uncharacterized protein n=1 Tax=Arundo donax TaxID=35708 RepID=A0A0A9AKY2_ARUDO